MASVAVDKSIANLKLSQAVGQRIIYAYDGWTPPRLLREMIGRGEVGGIIIFKRNVKSDSHLAATLKQLQAIPRPAGLKAPLLIMVDQEGGRVKRLAGPPGQSPGRIGRIASAAFTNEDLKINRLNIQLVKLTKTDLFPFKRAPARSMVITSTGIYPALDKQPALFSKRIVMGELRQKLGFAGISITDDLEVPALQSFGSTTTRGKRAIEAGNDLLLFCVSLREGQKALLGLTALYRNKRLDSKELFRTTARILAFRQSLQNDGARKAASNAGNTGKFSSR